MTDPLDSRSSQQAASDGLGELRESLSALRNLQQLLASIHAGPKLLSGLLPEVRGAAERMVTTGTSLLDYVASRGSRAEELLPIRTYTVETAEALSDVLKQASRGSLLAKRRLHLEATIAQMAPELTSLVEHLELLLEAATGVAVSLPLAELLSSRPSHGSSRPLANLLVVGPAEDVNITVPPRVGLGALSLLSQATSLQGRPALVVSRAPGQAVQLKYQKADQLMSTDGPRLTCQVPVTMRIPPSFAVARHVLCSFGAEFFRDDPPELSLPEAEED